MSGFEERHIGPDYKEKEEMLQSISCNSIDELIEQTIPSSIRLSKNINIGSPISEFQYLKSLKKISLQNKVYTSLIGLGYYNTITPSVIQRTIFENPGWYTQYTPYQAEIAQGRLEALLNFQTMVSDLTGLPLANASLLDEGTAAAEAMHMLYEIKNKKHKKNPKTKFFISKDVFPQTIDVIKNRALPNNIELVIDDPKSNNLTEDYFAVLLQYPNGLGSLEDYSSIIDDAKSKGIYVIMACDILSLALLTPPGELGADVAIGNTQRLGIPLGFGGPHAAYFACTEDFKRQIPGRIIGVSLDKHGNRALRMALQTREQHIKREKATSNICTAQALLAIMAGMYAVYHGPKGIKEIAEKIHQHTARLSDALEKLGYQQLNESFFDTIIIKTEDAHKRILALVESMQINLRIIENGLIGISLDEKTDSELIDKLIHIFAEAKGINAHEKIDSKKEVQSKIQNKLKRNSSYLTHPVFNTHHSETEMLRYIRKLENRDLSLAHSMISLGSCTMKLNAATELMPLSWRQFSNMHPFVPKEQALGYYQIIEELERDLCEITGFDACSLQPNSGAQGEYAGLMVIRAYHLNNGDVQRNVALIPRSAHGTNPASAVMAGMKVVVVNTDELGNIDVEDLRQKAEEHKDDLSCLMVTYPSTHGVFEESIQEVCSIIHNNGGKVYMDGANMNAQVGLTSPANIGADVCHLNLHKTFAIPHGGGGPGMGPICCTADLAPYLPGNPIVATGGQQAIPAISAAPWGSASILIISYGYIKMLGSEGLKNATECAILNANYLKSKLEKEYPILYAGKNGKIAHEFILDFRPFKQELGVDVGDVAKRLMDYGFHAPTVSFPVPGTMMVEPTESEPKAELDRFIEAMLSIKKEINAIADGITTKEDNPIVNAPHTAPYVTNTEWTHAYSRQEAAFPLPYILENKFWPYVGKVDNTYGDRNLICTCPPLEAYEE